MSVVQLWIFESMIFSLTFQMSDFRSHRPANAGLARAAAALFAGLLVIRDALDVLGQTFLFAHLLEAAEHLLGRLIAATLNLNHFNPFCSFGCRKSFDI